MGNAGKCDLFTGEWIPNPLGPIYTNESCHVVEEHQNCMKNGRPDSGYLYWRWKPHGCELPLFDSERFLEAMRNKSFAFIGDSISRNHVQSLLCILSKVRSLLFLLLDLFISSYSATAVSPYHRLSCSTHSVCQILVLFWCRPSKCGVVIFVLVFNFFDSIASA